MQIWNGIIWWNVLCIELQQPFKVQGQNKLIFPITQRLIVFVWKLESTPKILSILSQPHPLLSTLKQYSNETTDKQTSPSLSLLPLPPFHASNKSESFCSPLLPSPAGFKNNNYTKWFIASLSQRSEQPLYQEDPLWWSWRTAFAVMQCIAGTPESIL